MKSLIRFLPPALLAGTTALAVACGGSDKPQPQAANTYPPGYQPQPGQPGYGQPGYGQPGYGQPGGTQTSPPGYPGGGGPPGYPTTTAPGGYPTTTAPPPPTGTGAPPPPPQGGGGGTAQPIDPNVAGPAGLVLNQIATTEAPGQNKEGPMMAGNFQTGQTLEQTVQFTTGRCYTIVAAGLTASEWEFTLLLVPGPLPLNPVLNQERGTGTSASMGGKGNCFKWNWPPAQVRAVVKMTRGSGVGAAQLYSK